MTICKGCQELGPLPYPCPRGKRWTRAWALMDDPHYMSPKIEKSTNRKSILDRNREDFVNDGGYVNHSIDNKHSFVVDTEGYTCNKSEQNNYKIDAERNIPLNFERNRFLDDDGRACLLTVDNNCVHVDKGNDDISNAIRYVDGRNTDVDTNPVVYILNNADDIIMDDVELKTPGRDIEDVSRVYNSTSNFKDDNAALNHTFHLG